MYYDRVKERTGINYFWSIDNSVEFVKKVKYLKAESIQTFDFATLYTNLPLDVVYKNLEGLIIKMFRSHTHILVDSKLRKATFRYEGLKNEDNYVAYTLVDVLDMLNFILRNSYVQFAGLLFRQDHGIGMGGNASPIIADLTLIADEINYMTELVKTDADRARLLSNTCRFQDDIAPPNCKYFGSISKDIYDKSLTLEQSSINGKKDTFLDLNIRVHRDQFLIGIYHKVDDFNFDVINFPFPASNVSNSEGPKTFYSQLVRFSRLCNNLSDFLFRVHFTYNKLVSRGYNSNELYNKFKRFCINTEDWKHYNIKLVSALWDKCIHYDDYVTVNLENKHAVCNVIKDCSISLLDITKYGTKLHTSNPFDIDVINRWRKDNDILVCDAENTDVLREVTDNDLLGNTIVQKSYVPCGLDNPSNYCYLNSILQVFACILLHEGVTNYDSFSDTKGYAKLAKRIIVFKDKHKDLKKKRYLTAVRNSLAKLLSSKDHLFSCEIQQDAHQCLLIFLDILHTGTFQNFMTNVSSSQISEQTSFPNYLFQTMVLIIARCTICNHEIVDCNYVYEYFIHATTDCTVQNLLKASVASSRKQTCSGCNSDTVHVIDESTIESPRILRVVVKRFDNQMNKLLTPICINKSLQFHETKYELLAIIHHHGDDLNSGHYTATVKYHSYHCLADDSETSYDISLLKNCKTSYILFFKKIQ
jgi:ubiquitin C-terminal hydrolase